MHLCFKMRYPCMDATFSNMITECVKTNDGLIQHTYSFGLNFYFFVYMANSFLFYNIIPYLAFNPFIYINIILEIPLQNTPLFLENLDM